MPPTYRVTPTCPHTRVEQVRISVNGGGMQTFCKSCGEMIAWSTREDNTISRDAQRRIDGEVTELTEEERKQLA